MSIDNQLYCNHEGDGFRLSPQKGAISPAGDSHKFPLELIMYQAVMRTINPSLVIRDQERKLIEDEALAIHHTIFGGHQPYILSNSSHLHTRKGSINGFCNQLKREHRNGI